MFVAAHADATTSSGKYAPEAWTWGIFSPEGLGMAQAMAPAELEIPAPGAP